MEIVYYSIIVWIKQIQRKCVTVAIQGIFTREGIYKEVVTSPRTLLENEEVIEGKGKTTKKHAKKSV